MERMRKNIRFGSIFFINFGIKEVIDFILTPILMIEFGYILSLLTTTSIYLLIGIASVKIYDRHKQDCLYIEALKKAQADNKPLTKRNKLTEFILSWTKRNKIIFSLLLTFKNPGLFVIYFRDGVNLFNGFAGKNIKIIFLINLLVMNLYWNFVIYTGTPLWKFIGSFLYRIWLEIINHIHIII